MLAIGGALLVLQALTLEVYACPFRAVTGLPCPGCGLTRGGVALLHGHFSDAWNLHPFSPLLWVALVLLLGAALWPRQMRPVIDGLERLERRTYLTHLLALGFVGFGIWRLLQ